MKFGEHLKQARITRHLTQEEVSEKFFISRQTISSWENEKTYPDIVTLIKLSDFYQISLDTLLKEDIGMKEYLEKKNVITKLKPIKWCLTVIGLILIAFWLVSLSYSNIFVLLALVITIFVITALARLNELDQINTLNLKYNWQKYFDEHSKINYLVFTIILILAISLIIYQLQNINFNSATISGTSKSAGENFGYIIGYIFGDLTHRLLSVVLIIELYKQCVE
ncbi:helix-turn-helix transcriptional regulator [Lactobacillus sp. ESL0731]|uniref:helix-turn-helix domain-containing protein n=1 Tax=unclassified Lactobacillus TaxID=2620435 RepID=UPI0023F83CFE|nr:MULTISPECIES: helix-turn-helix transcriptional regulator [unclassified Lactobacillus]WEV51129.1 helix-turn-helix transcriptional regulator [Lactobacillus sp. ESL0700]WEV62258.1 helix-turn-helix transcriptional regulator [Lactobacillus sp. ESL0731]